MEWSGNVDLADGSVQQQFEKYRQNLNRAGKVGLNRASATRKLKNDVEFHKANNLHSEKLTHAKHSEKEMIVLAWTIKELSELNEIGRKLW